MEITPTQTISLNQIWKKYDVQSMYPNLSFAEWLDMMHKSYDGKTRTVTFESFVEKQMKVNRTGGDIWNALKDATLIELEKTITHTQTFDASNPNAKRPNTTIFGINKYVAYGIGGLILIGITYGIISSLSSDSKSGSNASKSDSGSNRDKYYM